MDINQESNTGCESMAKEKHIEILEAISSLRSVNSHLIDIIERIRGPEISREDEKPGSIPTPPPNDSLLHVLTTSAEEIRDIEKESHCLIHQITNLIY